MIAGMDESFHVGLFGRMPIFLVAQNYDSRCAGSDLGLNLGAADDVIFRSLSGYEQCRIWHYRSQIRKTGLRVYRKRIQAKNS